MKIIGIGEFCISSDPQECIKTFSLGSCVALTIYCPKLKIAGMVHIALPAPANDVEGYTRPGHYAQTAIPLLLSDFKHKYGCTISGLEFGMFGGAFSLRENDIFRIGQRNVQTIQQIAADTGMRFSQAITGGNFSRTVEIEVGTGEVRIHSQRMIL